MTRRVLIVEDNDDCRTLMALFLTRLGYSVIEAKDGMEAIDKAAVEQPQLIFMDFRMPKMNGLEATTRLKENPVTMEIPVVICTAFGPEGYNTTKLADYAAEIVQKPLQLELLQALMQKYLPFPNLQAGIP